MYATTSSNGAISSNGPDGQTSDEYNDGSKQSTGTSRLSYRMALPRPTTCPAEIYDLMFECWQLNEHTRPSFRDITQFMTTRNNVAMEQVYAWNVWTYGHINFKPIMQHSTVISYPYSIQIRSTINYIYRMISVLNAKVNEWTSWDKMMVSTFGLKTCHSCPKVQ